MLTHAYENFFLYHLENIIKPTFATEIQKEVSIYGLISFSGETKKKKKKKKLDLIKPTDSLKFKIWIDRWHLQKQFEFWVGKGSY